LTESPGEIRKSQEASTLFYGNEDAKCRTIKGIMVVIINIPTRSIQQQQQHPGNAIMAIATTRAAARRVPRRDYSGVRSRLAV
jgi:hypothetical protein